MPMFRGDAVSLRKLITVSILFACAGCKATVIQTQPKVPEGGRAVAIAVRPDNDQRMIVASETGGLFRTGDGGITWTHIDGFPSHFAYDVAYASFGSNIVIATTRSRYRAVNDGGIWRSIDGGDTWTQPAGAAPATSVRCPSRPSAYGISFQPLTRNVYVGTDCGLAVSQDNGATWTHLVLDPTGPIWSDSLQNRVWSVLVFTNRSGVAAAADGMWFRAGSAGAWTKASSGPVVGQQGVIHAFAISPWSGSHFFHAGGNQKLWMSVDGGANWTLVDSPTANNRPVFVRAARAVSGDDTKFDVYFGDGLDIHRQTFTHASSGPIGSGSWTKLTVDHSDPADIAFDVDHRMPILLATDGGLHRTANNGTSWSFTGGGANGYNALQITEITGQLVTGSVYHLDLYFGTQDNHVRASGDGGATWPTDIGGEGFFLRTGYRSVDHQGAKVTGVTCGNCGNFIADPHFASVAPWVPPPDGDTLSVDEWEGTPFMISPGSYMQLALDDDLFPVQYDFYLTMSSGAAWSKSFSLAPQPQGPIIFAGPPANSTAYQGVRRPGNLPNGGRPYGLMRIRNIAGTASVGRADSAGIGSLGILPTMFAWYMAFGADPNNENDLIAPDVENGEMKYSVDGGAIWYPMPQLTAAVTDTGKFLFEIFQFPMASTIAFDPYDSCHILVGTAQNGVTRSTNGGATWSRIAHSEAMSYITSFYFPPTGTIWVSTYGRGLWRLNLRRSGTNGKCSLPRPRPGIDTSIVVDPVTGSTKPFRRLGDPPICPACSYTVVRNGWITGLRTTGDTVQEIAISGGTIAQVDSAGKETALAVPNVYQLGEGRFSNRVLSQMVRPPRRMRAVVLDGKRLRAAILSSGDLDFAPSRTPVVTIRSANTVAGLPTVLSGERMRVIGTGFLETPSRGQPVRILVNRDVVAQDVPVRADGTFTVEIQVRGLPGDEVEIAAEQHDGLRLSIEKAVVKVVSRDLSGKEIESRRPGG
jgi:hypothetical protein